MNAYGELTKAQLENLTSNPSVSSARSGRLWYRTDLTAVFMDTGGTAQRFPWELFSRTANPAASGVVRFARADTMAWRNQANGADLPLGVDASDNLSYNSHAFLSSAGLVLVAAGGTGLASYSIGDILYATGSTTLAKLAIGTANQLLRTNAGATAPEWATVSASYTAPTIQKFTSTGATTGYLFTVTAAAATAGATYTNNGNTYTVLGTIAGGTQLFCSQAAAPQASGTLTKASGSGDATITFSAALILATYTKPANVLYLRVRAVGGGGGGGAAATNAGVAGVASVFGTALLSAGGGNGGLAADSGGVGGSSSLGTAVGIALAGSGGGAGWNTVAGNYSGGCGGASAFGGGGRGASAGTAGSAGGTNTGGGGGGGSQGATSGGGGGGSGGYVDVIITSPDPPYVYAVGTGGAGGSAGSQAGGAGGSGLIEVTEYYQ